MNRFTVDEHAFRGAFRGVPRHGDAAVFEHFGGEIQQVGWRFIHHAAGVEPHHDILGFVSGNVGPIARADLKTRQGHRMVGARWS